MESFVGVIMAAGHGTRMKSQTPKVLHKIFDQSMVSYCATTLVNAGANHLIVIVGHGREQVIQEVNSWQFEDVKISLAVQEEQHGTGHAAKIARSYLAQQDQQIVVMYGDTPLVRSETITELVASHVTHGRALTMVSTVVPDSFGYGRIVRDSTGKLLKITEEKDASEAERLITEINPGLYCYQREQFISSLEQVTNNNAQNEYYITDTIEILLASGQAVDALMIPTYEDFLGVNNRLQLAAVTKTIQTRINNMHMLNGVTLMDPDTTYISMGVSIGADTTIYPNTTLAGKTVIGQGCHIGPNSTLQDVIIGDESTLTTSTATQATIGDHTNVGPYAYLRPGTVLGNHVKIGDFVEVKNATFGDGSKASHLSYIGDATIGSDVNLGCGIITVNYDGKQKYQTVVEDNAFVGCNSNLVAPVTVGQGAYVAAGTTVTQNVDQGALAIGRSRQETKPNWLGKNLGTPNA